MRTFSRPIAFTVACALAAALSTPASAAPSAASPFGFAIDAVGFKSYFILDGHPGGNVTGGLRISNLTPGAKTIRLQAVDVSTASSGGLQYGNGAATREGRWLSLALSDVRLADGGSTTVPFTVTIPPAARPGDHFVGITAVDLRVLRKRTLRRGSLRLRLIPRLAMTVQVRIPGPRRSALSVAGAQIAVAPSGAAVALAIANPGNTLIPSTTGTVTVSQQGSMLFKQGVELASFVPQTGISYRVPWQGTPVQGTYRVQGELRPAGAPVIHFDRTVTFGSGAIHQFQHQTGKQAKASSGTSLLLILALCLAVGIAAALGIGYVRARRKLAER